MNVYSTKPNNQLDMNNNDLNAQVDINNNEVVDNNDNLVSLSFNEKAPKTFRINNVDDFDNLSIEAPELHYEVFSTENPNDYTVKYNPVEGSEHLINVSYNNKPVKNSPFLLTKRPVSVDHDTENRIITLSNVYDHNKLDIQGDSLEYQLFADPENEQQYKLHYNIPDKDNIHDLTLNFNNKPVENGAIRLVPKNLQSDYEKGLVTFKNGKTIRQRPPNTLIMSHVPQKKKLTEKMSELNLNEDVNMLNDIDENNLGELVMENNPTEPPIMNNNPVQRNVRPLANKEPAVPPLRRPAHRRPAVRQRPAVLEQEPKPVMQHNPVPLSRPAVLQQEPKPVMQHNPVPLGRPVRAHEPVSMSTMQRQQRQFAQPRPVLTHDPAKKNATLYPPPGKHNARIPYGY